MNRKNVFVISIVALIMIAAGIYYFAFTKYQNIFNERFGVYERFCNINSQLDDFTNIQKKMEAEKIKLEEIYSNYNDYFITNSEINSSYKSRLEALFKQYEIELQEQGITQVELKKDGGKDKVSFNVQFKSGFDQLYQLLFDIEKISSVSDLKISYKGDVSFVCTPNLYSREVDDFFTGRVDQSMDEFTAKGYFKDISDKIISEMNIDYIPTWRDLFPVPRNPLFPGYVKKKVVVNVKKKKKTFDKPVVIAKPLPSDIVLEGVMFESNEPIAIVDGTLLKKGDIHKGATLVGIKQNYIIFEYYGKKYTVRMEN